MKKSLFLLLTLLTGFSGMVEAQTHIISKGRYVTSVYGTDNESQSHPIKAGDVIQVISYKQQTPHRNLVNGSTYDVFSITYGKRGNYTPTIVHFLPDAGREPWLNALKAAGAFKVISLGSKGNGDNGEIRPYDSYTLSAQQDKANGPILLTWDFFRVVNGKQKSVATFLAETKAMKWPL